MDFSDISSLYSDIYTTTANQTAKKLQNQVSNTDYSSATDEELMDACKQFEAYFIEQMYKGMLDTIPKSDDTSSSTSTLVDYYKDQMIQSIAEDTADQSSLGLAQMLYEQMKRNYGTSSILPSEDADASKETTGAAGTT